MPVYGRVGHIALQAIQLVSQSLENLVGLWVSTVCVGSGGRGLHHLKAATGPDKIHYFSNKVSVDVAW